MKEDLTINGWTLPQLKSNMRNQINISNIKVETRNISYPMQSSIPKLEAGSNVVGEIPISIKVKSTRDWRKKSDDILEHCIQEMSKKDNKNIVVLYDHILFKDVGKDLKRLIKDKKIIEYPSNRGRQKDISKVKEFIEKDNHILFTESKYFNGCEACNVIFLNSSIAGHRNCFLRAVKNLICVEVGGWAKLCGMKKENR